MTETTTYPIIAKNLSYIPMFFLGLSVESLSILAVLMVIDTVLGIARSMTLHGPASFTSRVLSHGLISKVLVLFIPVLIVWAGRGAGLNFHPIASGTISVLVLAEAYSVLGHIQAIRTGEDIKEYDAVSMILRRLRGMIMKILESTPEKGKRK